MNDVGTRIMLYLGQRMELTECDACNMLSDPEMSACNLSHASAHICLST